MQYSANNKLKLLEGTDLVQRQDFVDNFAIIDDGLNKFYVATLVSANTYKITTGNNFNSLNNGYGIRVAIPSDSTNAVSVIVDNVTVPVKMADGTVITDFKTNGVYSLTYYNSVFICASGGKKIDTVTFTSDKLLTGYTANDSDGKSVSGSMINNGTPSATLNCGGTYNIQEGYYSGGQITTNSLANQTIGDVASDKILNGYTAWSNGNKITGNMPNLSSSSTIEYGFDNATKVIRADELFRNINTDNVERICFRYADNNGYITGNTLFGLPVTQVASRLGITADKIVTGNEICGVTGTATASTMGGINCKTGEVNMAYGDSSVYIELGFKPSFVSLSCSSSANTASDYSAIYSDNQYIKVSEPFVGTINFRNDSTTNNLPAILACLAGTSGGVASTFQKRVIPADTGFTIVKDWAGSRGYIKWCAIG